MSDTRSRSEIESALSGTQRLHKRKVTMQNEHDALNDFDLDSHSPRRRQVIGGNLTGVSKRGRRNGMSNKFSNINITNWLAVIVVISILVAFFWPNNNTESIREIAEQNIETQTESFYTESRIDEEQQAEAENESFGRQTDLDRANNFRTQEQTQEQIEELLINAKQHIAKGQYTNPKDNNALHSFREVLDIDPTNSDAKNGIKNIKAIFLRSGQAALKDNNDQRATSILNTLSAMEPDSKEATTLSDEIAQWRIDTEVAQLISKAEQAKDDDNLILPADQSSLFYFREVLKIDSDNDEATKGIKDLTNYYIERANKAVIDGKLEEATGYLASATVIEPKSASIDIVRNMIATAEPIAAQAELKRQQTPEIKDEPKIENNTASTEPTRRPTSNQISDTKTPQQQANEQAEFDRIYLNQGLEAYYKGDYDTAAALLQPLADKGVSRAQFRIGYMHYLGRGFSKNTTEADKVLRAALPAIQKFANEGRSWAQSDLGSLYEDGLVLPRNYTEALYWYRSAAEKGYPGAQTNLGIMYARGRGVTTSRSTAIEWFQRAAAQGDIAAQRNLQSLGVN